MSARHAELTQALLLGAGHLRKVYLQSGKLDVTTIDYVEHILEDLKTLAFYPPQQEGTSVRSNST